MSVPNASDYSIEDDPFTEDAEDIKSIRSSAISSGWDAVEDVLKSEKKKFASEFKIGEEETLIKFVAAAPFALYSQHWIKRSGKQSHICLGDDCPLCDIGDTPRRRGGFSVVDLSQPEIEVKALYTSPTLLKILYGYNNDPRLGPLDKHFWAIKKSGEVLRPNYHLRPVRAQFLGEEFGLDGEKIVAQIAELEPLTDKILYVTPRAELLQIAREVSRG